MPEHDPEPLAPDLVSGPGRPGHQPDQRDQPAAGIDLGELLGGLGGGGFGDLLAQAQEAMAASAAAAEREVEGSAGGGVVRIRATVGAEVLGVHIDPKVVDPSDVETLEDLVMAALRDLNVNIAAVHAEAMGAFDPSAMLGGLLGGGQDHAEADWDDDDEDEDDPAGPAPGGA